MFPTFNDRLAIVLPNVTANLAPPIVLVIDTEQFIGAKLNTLSLVRYIGIAPVLS